MQTQKDAAEAEGKSKKQVAMSSLFIRTMESSLTRRAVAFSLVETFTALDTPLEKFDHPKIRDYLNPNV